MSCPLGHLLPELAEHAMANEVFDALVEDSRWVEPNCLYVARAGINGNGLNYLLKGLEQQPAVVLVDEDELAEYQLTQPNFTRALDASLASKTTQLIKVTALEAKWPLLVAKFYGSPAQRLTLVGITGTNGKTSCASFIAQGLTELGVKAAVIGTLGNGVLSNLSPSNNTTPGPLALNQLFVDFIEQGVTHVVMEVSSHALAQNRVAGLVFDVAGFTNLTHDHLDFHGTFEAYGEAKSKLFEPELSRCAVINCHDGFGAKLYEKVSQPVLGVGKDVTLTVAQSDGLNGQRCLLTHNGEQATVVTQQLGDFTLENFALSAGVLLQLGYSFDAVAKVLPNIQAVAGRMERIDLPKGAVAIVDYAHTPDALDKLLHSARKLTKQELICVFGCGGDRDKDKRAIMGEIAASVADKVIITSDNPRSEPPLEIIKMIQMGVPEHRRVNVITEPNREQAIIEALLMSRASDIVLVAGKGHETYQEVQGKREYFSDQQTIKRWLQEQTV